MEQLVCRFYPREEIAVVLSVNVQDSRHFARNVKNTLTAWGYTFDYSRQGVTILTKPESAAARLKEILIRKLHLDAQIDPLAFACFICAFRDIDIFFAMPWEERVKSLRYHYHVETTERTLRNWCKYLFREEIASKGGELTYWKTERDGQKRIRTMVDVNDPDRLRYIEQRSLYLEEERKYAAERGLSAAEANKSAWDSVYLALWNEFHCCYYSCNAIVFNAIGEAFVYDIHELSEEIAATAGIQS